MKYDESKEDRRRGLSNYISGQVALLRQHDYWIIAFGVTQRSGIIHSKLVNSNLTSGDYHHILFPTQSIVVPTNRGEFVSSEKIFPGYFLLGVQNDEPAWMEMQSEVEEIFRILTHSGDPKIGRGRVAFLTPDEREHIISLIEEIPHDSILDKFSVGDRVIVTDGSFKGLDGRIMEIQRTKKRAKVHIQIRNTIFPTWFSMFNLEANSNPGSNGDGSAKTSLPEVPTRDTSGACQDVQPSIADSNESETTISVPVKS